MQGTDHVINQTLELVAQSRARRERYERERKAVYSRIQIGKDLQDYLNKPGQQLLLKLNS